MLGLVSAALGVPYALLIRIAVSGDAGTDSLVLLILKFTIILVIAFVPLYKFVRDHFSIFKKSFKNLCIMVICNVISSSFWIMSVEQSNASYASIVMLLAPIVLVILSAKLVKDRMTRRAAAGISLAAVGGILVVALPALLQGSAISDVYPLATILLLINCIANPLVIVFQRRSHEQGVPLTALVGLVALVAVPVLSAIYIGMHGGDAMINAMSNLSWQVWVAALYSGLIISFAARNLAARSYEHTGAAVRGGLTYLETLLSVVLPIIVLGEHLSIEMMVGALLILVGVFLAESGSKHHFLKLGFKRHPRYFHRHGRFR